MNNINIAMGQPAIDYAGKNNMAIENGVLRSDAPSILVAYPDRLEFVSGHWLLPSATFRVCSVRKKVVTVDKLLTEEHVLMDSVKETIKKMSIAEGYRVVFAE